MVALHERTRRNLQVTNEYLALKLYTLNSINMLPKLCVVQKLFKEMLVVLEIRYLEAVVYTLAIAEVYNERDWYLESGVLIEI